ncbi:unnamed protein product [Peronospora farinosa]|uniref:Uncharacterized protein n=1 Tax=Peronospora farinosa TaxID=134698 RepID=A0AAV0T898_9STRA|nr:unnamed protein product [Peronospora farinosa]CAI5715139.1 unnamed protein product [Peronospora farinosa]
MIPTPMEQAAHSQDRCANHDPSRRRRSQFGSGACDRMARLLGLITDLKGDIIAWLDRLEAHRVEDDQTSDMSAGSSTFCTYAEARTGLSRNMTLASLEDKVVPGPARQHAAGLRQKIQGVGRGGIDSPPQVP